MKYYKKALIAFEVMMSLQASAQNLVFPHHFHESLLTIDSHTDTPMVLLRSETDFMKNNCSSPYSKVDYPTMLKGWLDAVIFAVFTPQGSLDSLSYHKAYILARKMFARIDSLIQHNSDKLALATSANDIQKNYNSGKLSILIGIENGYPLNMKLDRVKEFYDLGARYITLCHSKNNQLCSSSTDKNQEEGLSDFGKEVVRKMNRLGMMVDVSHISDKAFWDVISLTSKPVIASHSSARAICDHPRNLSDKMLEAIAKNGGVVQVCILSDYVKKIPPDLRYDSAFHILQNRFHQFENLTDTEKKLVRKEIDSLQKVYPRQLASVHDLVDHIDHIVKVAGIDHVGIGSDFDGGGGLADCKDVSEIPNITSELIRRGYSAEEIQKIWGGNLMRVLQAQ
jgi:membrane dipeptidase